jgi:hypothetical protein
MCSLLNLPGGVQYMDLLVVPVVYVVVHML